MKKHFKIISIAAALFILNACEVNNDGKMQRMSMYESSTLTQRGFTFDTKRYVEKKSMDDIDYDYLRAIADDYAHHGNSPMYVVMGYNTNEPREKQSVTNQSNVVKGQLARLGVRNAIVKAMPLNGENAKPVVVGYDRLTARGPKDCGVTPGYKSESGYQGNYGLGCGVRDMMARQAAYPSDLMGKSEMSAFEAGRVAAPVNRDPRSGEISEFVPSYILSQLAN